jgi:hypothetical protein
MDSWQSRWLARALGVVHYGKSPKNLSETAKNSIRLNPYHSSTVFRVNLWQKSELTDVTAKVVIYEAFVEGKLEAPKHLARTVHDLIGRTTIPQI